MISRAALFFFSRGTGLLLFGTGYGPRVIGAPHRTCIHVSTPQRSNERSREWVSAETQLLASRSTANKACVSRQLDCCCCCLFSVRPTYTVSTLPGLASKDTKPGRFARRPRDPRKGGNYLRRKFSAHGIFESLNGWQNCFIGILEASVILLAAPHALTTSNHPSISSFLYRELTKSRHAEGKAGSPQQVSELACPILLAGRPTTGCRRR